MFDTTTPTPPPAQLTPRHSRRRSAPSPLLKARGFSILEVLLVSLIVALLASIVIPQHLCAVEKSRVAGFIAGIIEARDAVESFRIDHQRYPAALEEVFDGRPPPPWLLYCSAETADANKGHGNDCDRSDEDNPSGKPGPQAIDAYGYRLWTTKGLAPGCQQIDYLHLTGGFGPPRVVRLGEKAPGSDKLPRGDKPPKNKK